VAVCAHFAAAHTPEALVSGEVVLHATPIRFGTLLVGALIALLYRGALREQMQRAAQAILAVAVLCAQSVCAYWIRFHNSKMNDAVLGHTWLYTLIAIFSGALMLRTLIPGTIPHHLFNLRWLRLIGTVSYGAYVFHDIPYDEYRRQGWTSLPPRNTCHHRSLQDGHDARAGIPQLPFLRVPDAAAEGPLHLQQSRTSLRREFIRLPRDSRTCSLRRTSSD
jgi:hypothetical protein